MINLTNIEAGKITEDFLNDLNENFSSLNDGKVDKDGTKVLSDNNFTDSNLSRLNNIEENAEVNAINTITANDVLIQPDLNKNINIIIPTELSDLSDDSASSPLNRAINDSSGNKIIDTYQIKKPNGFIDLIDENNKIDLTYLSDFVLNKVIYGGKFNTANAIASLTSKAKIRLKTDLNNIVLTNDDTNLTGYVDNENIYYIASAIGTFAGIYFNVDDILFSTGGAWFKIGRENKVLSVNEKIGAVVLSASDVKALPDTVKYGKSVDLTYTALTGEVKLDLKDQNGTILSTDAVDLPFKLIIESGTVETCIEDNEPVEGYKEGDKYIDLVLANKTHIYILVSDLVDQVDITTTGTGNSVTDISANGNDITVTKEKTFIETNEIIDDLTTGGIDVPLSAEQGKVLNKYKIGGNTLYGGTVVEDLNIIEKSGFYTCYGTATGVPNEDYNWFIIHENSNVDDVTAKQTATAYLSTDIISFIRVKTASIWGDWFRLESTNNLVISLNSSSTDTQYPSAKAVYDDLNARVALTETSATIGNSSITDNYFTGNIHLTGSIKDATNTFTLPNTSGTIALAGDIPNVTNFLTSGNIKAGDNVTVSVSGNDITINSADVPNIVYGENEPDEPIIGMIWLKPKEQ